LLDLDLDEEMDYRGQTNGNGNGTLEDGDDILGVNLLKLSVRVLENSVCILFHFMLVFSNRSHCLRQTQLSAALSQPHEHECDRDRPTTALSTPHILSQVVGVEFSVSQARNTALESLLNGDGDGSGTKKEKNLTRHHHTDAYHHLRVINHVSRERPPRNTLRRKGTTSVNMKGCGCTSYAATTPPATPFSLWRFNSKPTI
jgi:hypothetical protein